MSIVPTKPNRNFECESLIFEVKPRLLDALVVQAPVCFKANETLQKRFRGWSRGF